LGAKSGAPQALRLFLKALPVRAALPCVRQDAIGDDARRQCWVRFGKLAAFRAHCTNHDIAEEPMMAILTAPALATVPLLAAAQQVGLSGQAATKMADPFAIPRISRFVAGAGRLSDFAAATELEPTCERPLAWMAGPGVEAAPGTSRNRRP
jgi:hypothetical protein